MAVDPSEGWGNQRANSSIADIPKHSKNGFHPREVNGSTAPMGWGLCMISGLAQKMLHGIPTEAAASCDGGSGSGCS